jgi:hypothetical protein
MPRDDLMGNRRDAGDPAAHELSPLDEHLQWVEKVARKLGIRATTAQAKIEHFMGLGFDRDDATALLRQEVTAGLVDR